MKLSDEQIIAALIECGSITDTAAKLGCNRKTLYARMAKQSFKDLYSQFKSDMIRTAAAKLQKATNTAIDTLYEVMIDESVAKQTRVYCAVSVMQYAIKFTETADIIERLETLEAAQSEMGAALCG